MITLEVEMGIHISAHIEKAVSIAHAMKEAVQFTHNDIPIIVQPVDTKRAVGERWERAMARRQEEHQRKLERESERQLRRQLNTAQTHLDNAQRQVRMLKLSLKEVLETLHEHNSVIVQAMGGPVNNQAVVRSLAIRNVLDEIEPVVKRALTEEPRDADSLRQDATVILSEARRQIPTGYESESDWAPLMEVVRHIDAYLNGVEG